MEAKEEWFEKIHYATRRDRPHEPLQFAKVRITRCSSGARPDFDNLQHSAKFLLDGLQKAGILAGDGPEFIGVPLVFWEPAKPKKQMTRIQLVECHPHDLDLRPWQSQEEQ